MIVATYEALYVPAVVAEGPSARTPPAEAFASYVQVSPVCQVGASKELGLGPVPASVPPGRFGFARFIRVVGPTAKATKAEAPTIHTTIAARVVRCIPILRVASGRIFRSDIWPLLDGHETSRAGLA